MEFRSSNQERPRRAIRSYVLRGGRVTASQQRALREQWPRYGIEFTAAPIDLAATFGRIAPCTVEIGFGNGEHLLVRAQSSPERNFIGIEVHRAGIGHLLAGAARIGLTNLRVIAHDAVEVIHQCFAERSIDEMQILFPDPWPKSRHHKRRLIQPPFIASVATRLKSGGIVHLATDWEPYALEMLEVLRGEPLLASASGDAPWAPRPDNRALTRFESRGLRRGHPVHDLIWHRKRDA